MKELLKGEAAEEALRNYFLNIGYFVVRGCKFKYGRFDVTDVDLLLYGRNSPLSRERVNVDIKNKKTPQAMERILWAKGLQEILKLDGCVIATSDMRSDVREFGLQHHVQVLDGKFLSRLNKSEKSQLDRIHEEALSSEIDRASLGKLGGGWKERYEQSKSKLLDSLNFDGCNFYLNEIGYFLEQTTISAGDRIVAWRMAYLLTAYFLIALDFILREHVAAEQEQKQNLLDTGFRYGSAGKLVTEKVGKMAAALVASVAPQPGLQDVIEEELKAQAADVRADLLAEFFSKGSMPSTLFEVAKEFEANAFSGHPVMPNVLPSHMQATIGVLCDFFRLDRKRVLA